MNLHSKRESVRPGRRPDHPHPRPDRDGSSLPREEAGDGHLSVGFAPSSSPFLGALSFLFGLFFDSHCRGSVYGRCLHLRFFFAVCAGFALIDFFGHCKIRKKWNTCGLSHLEYYSCSPRSLRPSHQGRCAHLLPEPFPAGRPYPASGGKYGVPWAPTASNWGSESTFILIPSLLCPVPLYGLYHLTAWNPAFRSWSTVANSCALISACLFPLLVFLVLISTLFASFNPI